MCIRGIKKDEGDRHWRGGFCRDDIFCVSFKCYQMRDERNLCSVVEEGVIITCPQFAPDHETSNIKVDPFSQGKIMNSLPWKLIKLRRKKYRGIPDQTFHLHEQVVFVRVWSEPNLARISVSGTGSAALALAPPSPPPLSIYASVATTLKGTNSSPVRLLEDSVIHAHS